MATESMPSFPSCCAVGILLGVVSSIAARLFGNDLQAETFLLVAIGASTLAAQGEIKTWRAVMLYSLTACVATVVGILASLIRMPESWLVYSLLGAISGTIIAAAAWILRRMSKP